MFNQASWSPGQNSEGGSVTTCGYIKFKANKAYRTEHTTKMLFK